MAADTGHLKRFAAGPLHGAALVAYFVLLPFVVVAKWSVARTQSDGNLIRALLVALALFWVLFLVQFLRNVARVRRGLRVGGGGSAWLATILVGTLPFLLSHAAPSARVATPVAHAGARSLFATPRDESVPDPGAHSSRHPSVAHSVLALALAAKRRRDELRRGEREPDGDDVDATIDLLRAYDPGAVSLVRRVVGDRLDGVARVAHDSPVPLLPDAGDPVAVAVVEDDPDGAVVSFAREGGRLRVPVQWSDEDVAASVVGLHDGGRVTFTRTEHELVRALATRSLRQTLVVHLGPERALDDDLRACCVIVEPGVEDGGELVNHRHRFTPSTPTARSDVFVELLRAEPRVVGLSEPFTATLRRRCVEMVAYLALHRHEPITGDRLRTRVLTHADVDASVRTLSNTASAVRRSLGTDERGSRLHAVTSAGLYVTHGVTGDVELFASLVARARELPGTPGAPLLEHALSLVHGEPLASALRGFEWFLAEGHAARLQRDGEWAALALHRIALEHEDVETAFWALAQGRLIDPYSEALSDALARVPRSREFGGDRPGRAQHEAIRAGHGVAVGGPLSGLGE